MRINSYSMRIIAEHPVSILNLKVHFNSSTVIKRLRGCLKCINLRAAQTSIGVHLFVNEYNMFVRSFL